MDHLRETITRRIREESTPPTLLVLDLSASPYVDMHAAHMLGELAAELAAKGMRIRVVEARSSVRDRLRANGADSRLGG